MSNGSQPTRMVGNEFLAPAAPRLHAATPHMGGKPPVVIPVVKDFGQYDYEVTVRHAKKKPGSLETTLAAWNNGLDFIHKYSVGVFAILFLLVGVAGVQLAEGYYSEKIAASAPRIAPIDRSKPRSGINMQVPSDKLVETMKAIAAQPLTLSIAGEQVAMDEASKRDWVQIVTDQKTKTSYLHVKEANIAGSLKGYADKFSKSAVNQVSVEHGGVSTVIAGGSNGLKVSTSPELAKQIAKNLLSAKGMQMTLPAEPVAFQSVTPAAFDKLIEVNIVSKQMYMYEKGQLVRQYPISAGALETPTPLGQYKIFSKYVKQDMRGFNADGTKYFQPNVKYISYFKSGGYAIHGNYWRPTSWFGRVNSSHGCVSLPDYQAKDVFDWAPIGTTIINHT